MSKEVEWAFKLPWDHIQQRAFTWDIDFKLVGAIIGVDRDWETQR